MSRVVGSWLRIGCVGAFCHAAWAECPSTLAGLQQSVEAAETATGEAFPPLRLTVQADLACLDEPATPQLAAGVHRIEAMNAYLRRDLPAVVRAYRSAAALEPTWHLDEARFPEGHLLRDLHAQALAAPDGPITPIEGLGARVDGRPSAQRPADRPIVFQWTVDETDVLWSGYLRAGDAPPLLSSVLPPQPEPEPVVPQPIAQPKPKKKPVWLAATAGTTALAAGALWTGALVTRTGVKNEDIPRGPDADLQADMTRRAKLANDLGYAAQATSGAAVVLGVVTVVVW